MAAENADVLQHFGVHALTPQQTLDEVATIWTDLTHHKRMRRHRDSQAASACAVVHHFILVRFLQQRLHTRDLHSKGGLAGRRPHRVTLILRETSVVAATAWDDYRGLFRLRPGLALAFAAAPDATRAARSCRRRLANFSWFAVT